ncbi:MAG: hypothetical protein HKN26_15515 [Acidimicrobiales bacterium]|nr:hypothetical protein [Acidimicrobiales bacterium]
MNSQRAMVVTMSLKTAEREREPTSPTARPLVTQPALLRRAKVWALKPSSWSPERVRQNYVESGLTPRA